LELNAEKTTFSNELDIAKEGDNLKLKKVEFEGLKIDMKNNLQIDQMEFEAEQKHTKKQFQIEE